MTRKKLAMVCMALICVLTITLGLAFPIPVTHALLANIIYVRAGADLTGDTDGRSWEHAFPELQPALDLAEAGANDGFFVEIWVAAGTYYPTSDYGLTNDLTGVAQEQLNHFRLLNKVAVYGGFPADGGDWEDRDWEVNSTILRGDIDEEGDADCLHVFYHPEGWGLNQTAVLDGFTVSGGKTTLEAGKNHDAGGGMYNYSSSPAVSNVIFEDCFARWGAGMYNENSNPVLTNVTFQSNDGYQGAGMCNFSSNPTLSGVVFANNGLEYGNNGGGMYNQDSSPVFSDVTFIGNTASGMGGGMYNYNSHPTLTDVTFEANSGRGGGGMMNHVGSNPILSGVDFIGNDAGERQGGGMWNDGSNPQLTDVTFVGNTAAQGGGMYSYGSTPVLTDVLFEDNSAYSEVFEAGACGGGMHNSSSNAVLSNVIFQDNSADNGGGMYNLNSNPTLSEVVLTGNTAGYEYAIDTASDMPSSGCGGGMCNSYSSPVLDGVSFQENSAEQGGGMCNYDSYPNLSDVEFLDNHASELGGGVYNALTSKDEEPKGVTVLSDISPIEFNDVLFEGNLAPFGGGMLNDFGGPEVSLNRVTFRHNGAYGGGAIANACVLNVDGSVFEENSVLDEGFGVGGAIYQSAGELSIANTYFKGNEATVGGAISVGNVFIATAESGVQSVPGLYNTESDEESVQIVTVVNSVFSRNYAEMGGGGIYNTEHIELVNSTFSGNHAMTGGGMISDLASADIRNCIFWANTALEMGPQIYNYDSDVAIYNSLVEGAYPDGWDASLGTDGGSNIDANPLFKRNPSSGDEELDYGDLRLQAGSPARDSGCNDYIVGVLTDIAGNRRVSNRTVDMGAYEYQVAPPPPPAPVGPVLERLGGQDRYETAVEVSKAGWTSADTVFLARSDDFADSLAGVPLAYSEDAPILLTKPQALPQVTKAEIQRLGADRVVILGGKDAVSPAVEQELKNMGLTVERVGGLNRFGTAAAIAALVAPGGCSEVALANGYVFADALSVATYAARRGMPILLTNTGAVPAETSGAITGLNAGTVLVVGGTSVITAGSLADVDDYLRIAGVDRYATAIALAEHFTPAADRIFVATGLKFPDCLTGAVLAAKEGCGLILLNGSIPAVVENYLAGKIVLRYTVLGGTAAVSEDLANQLIK